MTDLYILPTADHYCMADERWTFTRELMVQEIKKAEQRGRESMREENVRLTTENAALKTEQLARLEALAMYVVDLEQENAKLKADAYALWMLLDDIDTADDMAKSDDASYRKLCQHLQRKRFAIMSGEQIDSITAAMKEQTP